MPGGACDCHFHIFGGPSRQVRERSYTAVKATITQYRHMAETLGLSRGVLVQPSVYGTDNRTTLTEELDAGLYKRVVVIAPGEDTETLDQYALRGVVGVRINLLFAGGTTLDTVTKVAKCAADRG